MSGMKRPIVELAQYTVLSGESEYKVDVPDGDAQVEWSIISDQSVTMFFFAGEVLVPWQSGTRLEGREVVRGLEGMLIVASPEATVAVKVHHHLATIADPVDDKPVAVSIVEPVRLSLADIIGREVSDRLAAMNGTPGAKLEAEADDFMDRLPEDVDPEFGVGHMEMENDDEMVARARRGAAGSVPSGSSEADGPGKPAGVENNGGTSVPGEVRA